jgi:uncharacterized repeat protein (TIGR01451 family)
VAALLVVSVQGTARADSIPVTNLNDSGVGSLRQAIANATAGDTITLSITGTIALTSGRLTITNDLTIAGPGAASLTISGNNASQIFGVFGATVVLSGVTMSGGDAGGGQGGGIENWGTLTLTDSVVTGNNARIGGGIYSSGTLNLTRSTVSGNTVSQSGGGLYINGATATLTDSTVSGNASLDPAGSFAGGGFHISSGTVNLTRSTVSGNTSGKGGGFWSGGNLNLTNSTVSGNSATAGIGGGIWVGTGTLTIVNSTITGNSSAMHGGGIFDNSADWHTAGIIDISPNDITSLVNTIIAGNTAMEAPDCYGGPVTSLGNNLLGRDSFCNYSSAAGDLVGTFGSPIYPSLGSLADNGGPTFTHPLLTGSPAIDAGGDSAAPPIDQRGVARPQGSASDIGAFELEVPADLSVVKIDSIDPVTAGNKLAYTVIVVNSGPNDAIGVTLTDTLPPGVTFVSSTPSQIACSESGGVVTGTLGTVANDASSAVTIAVTVDSWTTGSITNAASVTGNVADPNTGNNSVTAATMVNQPSATSTPTAVPGLGGWGVMGLAAVLGAVLVLAILFPRRLSRHKGTA